MVPGTLTSAVSSVIGWSSTDLSSIFDTFTLRSSVIDHPVSSYGPGWPGEELRVEEVESRSRLYGWSIRTM